MTSRRGLIIGGSALLLAACDKAREVVGSIPGIGPIVGGGEVRTTTPNIPVPNSPWRAQNSLSVVMENAPGGFGFSFPNQDGVHYVTRPPSVSPVRGTMTIRYFVVSENPNWSFKGDAPPPQVSAFIQRKGDQLSANTPDNRYWFSPRGQLTPGEHTIVAPINITGWTNVNGGKNDAGFMQTLNECANVGMTFGGRSFAGHGVWVSGGSARFTLLSFSIG